MIELLTDPSMWAAFVTLTLLELVLGIDNIIFIAILADKLPGHRRELIRRVGLFLAMFMRIALLLLLTSLVGMTEPVFHLFTQGISARDLILIGGGVFLIWKSTREIHHLLEGKAGDASARVRETVTAVLVQIILVDAVFSLDSIITAVGLVREIPVMIAAVVASVALMMAFAGPVGRFVSAHPTVKMLALAFLFAIGLLLIADGFEHHVPKGYVYFAMAFSVAVEALNLRLRKAMVPPVTLRERYVPKDVD